MCGISGVRRFDGVPVARETLKRMSDTLTHRGPDAEGFWHDGEAGFAHRRLSIIDLEQSIQPMAAGQHRVCFNGEIFNYRQLRDELARDGYCFQTNGDTEVLLAMHRRYGEDAVHRFEGQFAYALWNDTSRQLTLVRDRLGVLPLYFYFDGKVFAFASEIKALLAGFPERCKPSVNVDGVRAYLAHRSVPSPNTLFRNVYQVSPGCRARLSATGELSIEPYWRLPTAAADDNPGDADATTLLDSALSEAVRSYQVADVPVGAYLSGGVDSSLIVAMMRREASSENVETFCAGFDDDRVDERAQAREVSKLLGTTHHEVIVKAEDFERLWPRLTWHRDAPLSEPADVAVYALASLARSRVKVLLSGEGSDELFAGYPKYRFARLSEFFAKIPRPVRSVTLRHLEQLLPARLAKVRIALRAMSGHTEADRLQSWFAPFVAYERQQLCPGTEAQEHREIWKRTSGDLIQRMLYTDCHTWLSDNLLARGDRMAMAASVESRPPFMDHRVVNLAFSLSSSLKLRGSTQKWLVKEVARRYLPASVVDRKKFGFTVPLDSWFRSGLREMARDTLLARDAFVPDIFERSAVEALLTNHESGRRNEEIRLWTLLGLEIWHRTFFSRPNLSTPP